MSIKTRPGFAVNVDRTIKSTEKKLTFFKLQPAMNVNFRFLPTSEESGQLFYHSGQHFNFTEEGDKRVWGCLRVHGPKGSNCPICELVEKAREVDPDKFDKIIDKHKLSENYHAQVVLVPKDGEKVEQLFIARFTPYTAGRISAILAVERDNRQPLLSDPDKGQVINVQHNKKSGFQSRYEPQATGIRVPLDDLYPRWTEEFLNVREESEPKTTTREKLIESMRETLGSAVISTLLGPTFA